MYLVTLINLTTVCVLQSLSLCASCSLLKQSLDHVIYVWLPHKLRLIGGPSSPCLCGNSPSVRDPSPHASWQLEGADGLTCCFPCGNRGCVSVWKYTNLTSTVQVAVSFCIQLIIIMQKTGWETHKAWRKLHKKPRATFEKKKNSYFQFSSYCGICSALTKNQDLLNFLHL